MADPQRPLADETATEARIQENPVEKPTSAIKFAERKAVVYDELDHPELDLASLDKAYDKLDGVRTFDLPRVGIFRSDAWNLSLCPRQWGPLHH